MTHRSTSPSLAAAALAAVLAAGSSVAQEVPRPRETVPPAGAEQGRFTFQKMQDSILRLDSRTGQVSSCRQSENGWLCQAAPDDRAALDAEIGRLQGEIGRLQTEVAALRKELLAQGAEVPPAAEAPVKPQTESVPRMPSEADIGKVKSFIERVWRRLVELVAEIQRDIRT